MVKLSPLAVVVSVYLSLAGFSVNAQTCTDPSAVCADDGGQSENTSNGTNVTPPSSFCGDYANAIFYSFETLDATGQFSNIDYQDSTATVDISGINCDADTLLSQSVNIAVFAADDLCTASSFSDPEACATNVSGGQSFQLDGLLPSTTYYVMVSGAAPTTPATDAGECEVVVSVSGPAVTYDLGAEYNPEGDPDRTILFEGETLVLNANDQFPDLTWSGESLNNNSGSPVTANPEGLGETFEYTVTSEINECTYTDQVEVTIFPAVVPYTGFTPNGDGINDTWEIRNIHVWPNAQIIVYSRWGTKVFQGVNYSNDWTGDDLPAATYYYVIELNPVDFNVDPYTGSVTIMR